MEDQKFAEMFQSASGLLKTIEAIEKSLDTMNGR